MPHDDRHLKLCWSCVLEGAVPLPDSLLEDEEDEHNQRTVISLSPSTARGIAEDDTVSPTVAVVNLAASAAAAEAGGAYVAPQPPSPLDRIGARPRDGDGERRQRTGGKKKEGSGFLSALVSLIEVVASPTSPVRSRPGGGGATPGARKKAETKRPPVLSAATSIDDDSRGGGGADWRAGWSTPSGSAVGGKRETTAGRGGDSSPLLLRKEYDAESASRTQMLQAEDGGFPSPSTAGFMTESGDVFARFGSGDGVGNGSEGRGVVESGVGVLLDEKPVELGFPSERPWAHGFGS